MRRNALGVGALLGMMALILDAQTALSGARDGMELCWKTVVPSLFPFFVLSGLITQALCGGTHTFLTGLGKLCGIPQGAESLLLTGLLGGYPVGASSVAQAWRAGLLEQEEAQRMLGFCNNAGPSFLFGMVAALFPDRKAVWLLWAVHLLSALWVGVVIPEKTNRRTSLPKEGHQDLSASLSAAVRTMSLVCGWVVIFRVFIAFLEKWIFLWIPPAGQTLLIGLLELTNGCWALEEIADIRLRLILCSGFLAAGGFCVAMQTASVTKGLDLSWYYKGKLLQCLASLCLCSAVVFGTWWTCFPLLVPLMKKRKKGSSISPIYSI